MDRWFDAEETFAWRVNRLVVEVVSTAEPLARTESLPENAVGFTDRFQLLDGRQFVNLFDIENSSYFPKVG